MTPPCPLCGKPSPRLLNCNANDIHACGECHHTFMNLKPDDQEVYSPEYFLEQHRNWFEHPNYPLYEFIRRRCAASNGKEKMKVLDVGCGDGGLLRYLDEKGLDAQLFGIDLTENRHPRICYRQGDFLGESFEEKFDVVTSLAFLEHVDRPQQVLAKIANSLKPAGHCIVMTVNNGGLVYKVARMMNRLGSRAAFDRLYSPHHLQYYSNSSLRRLFESNGFEVLSQRNCNYPGKAIDVPDKGLRGFVQSATARLIFLLSEPFNAGMLQVVVARRRS